MHAARHPVPDDLASLVETGWSGAWDLPADAPHQTELLGDPSAHLVCEAGDRAGARVVGPWTRLWVRHLAGTGQVRAFKLHPGGIRGVFDRRACELTDRIVPLADLLGAEATEALYDAVMQPREPERGVGVLYDWLRAHRREEPGMWRAIRLVQELRNSEHTRVDAFADQVGLSVRALQRLFRTHVGFTPKRVLRRFRLQEVAARVELGQADTLGDLAYTLGYADQAHLARDFKAATGRSLTDFEARLDEPPAGTDAASLPEG